MTGRSLSPGMPDSTVRSSSRIRPASMLVSPSFSRIVVLISRLPKVGSPPKPVPDWLLSDDLQRQRHLVVVMRARRDVDVHADVLVIERRDRLLVDPAGGDRRERRSPAPAPARRTAPARRCPRTCAAAGWRACACSCRSSAAGSRAPGSPASSTSDAVRLRRSSSVRPGRLTSSRAGDARRTPAARELAARIRAGAFDRPRAARRRSRLRAAPCRSPRSAAPRRRSAPACP